MSRLQENSEEFRQRIESRNLYTPEDPYRIEEGRVVGAINSIASVLSPFQTFDVSNTVLARLVRPNTPLQQIGLEMLGKQFGHTARSLGSAEFLPSFSPENLFDGDPDTKLFTRKIDFQITRRETQSSVGRILEELTGSYRPINPFTKNPTNLDYFRQTGKGQQQLIIENLNRNIYKKSDTRWIGAIESLDIPYINPIKLSNVIGNPNAPARIFLQGKSVDGINDLNSDLYPFKEYELFNLSEINRQLRIEQALLYANNGFEYGSSDRFIESFGKANQRESNNESGDFFINSENFGLDDNTDNRIVWGRDGASRDYKDRVNALDDNRTESPLGDTSDSSSFSSTRSRFEGADAPITGLLAFTKELLNSKGAHGNFDLTKKKFLDRDQNLHFNGSPLSKNAQGKTDRRRQHSVADPYDRFIKAIRFQGNEIYGGRSESAINKQVIPRIAPLEGTGAGENSVDIKNLMFSLENLASPTRIKDKLAYLDDSNGDTQIPLCEAGKNGGRLMWFAPYDLKVSEQALSKHESTVFLGRSEPIYTYSHSERLANISFKLLIDYPPHVKNFSTDDDGHAKTARFFAFGGTDTPPRTVDLKDKKKKLDDLKKQKAELETTKEVERNTDLNLPSEVTYYFPNAVPKPDEDTSLSIFRSIAFGYEDGVIDGVPIVTGITSGTSDQDEIDGRDFGLNVGFQEKLTDALKQALSEDKRESVSLVFESSATVLFNSGRTGIAPSEFNKSLSKRRIEALREYIRSVYNSIPEFAGSNFDEDVNIGGTVARGSELATDDTSTPESISTKNSKSFRRATVRFVKNVNNSTQEVDKQAADQNKKRIEDVNKLNEQIQALETEIKNSENILSKGFECTFKQYTLEDGQWKGFRPTQRNINKFVPCFHSQTPEDFHRRLTFLQQCTRQGAAIRGTSTEDNLAPKNAVFGRQPVQVLRIGDFFHTKVIIENISFDYGDYPWDLNPEGMGMQFMVADVDIQMKIIGGMSLKTPIDALQNAVSFNYYANSTYFGDGVYSRAVAAENAQETRNNDVRNQTTDGDTNDATANNNETSNQ